MKKYNPLKINVIKFKKNDVCRAQACMSQSSC